jgi:hypothetical protein
VVEGDGRTTHLALLLTIHLSVTGRLTFQQAYPTLYGGSATRDLPL